MRRGERWQGQEREERLLGRRRRGHEAERCGGAGQADGRLSSPPDLPLGAGDRPGGGLVGEPAPHRRQHGRDPELDGQHQASEDQDDHEGRRRGPAEPVRQAGAEVLADRPGAAREDQAEEAEHGDHHQHAAGGGETPAGPGALAEEAAPVTDQAGGDEPGADAERSEQGVMHRPGDRTSSGKSEDDRRGAAPGQPGRYRSAPGADRS